MATKQYYFTLNGAWQRFKQEYFYYTKKPWSLKEVGDFWDTVEDYDDVNVELYPYFKRFTNSYKTAIPYLPRNDYTMLDIQARSGKGSLFWFQQGKIKHTTCVDFSDHLVSLAKRRLQEHAVPHTLIKTKSLPLPFADAEFDFIGCYETVEHIYYYAEFIKELSRIAAKDSIIIVTCPNRLWEIVHWITAIININHSEGPHHFLKRKDLLRTFRQSNLSILKENTTVILPFNNRISIGLDLFLEKRLPEIVKRYFGLRRTFILQKL